MLGFCGTFTCTIDDKGRLSIPARIRPSDPETSRRKGIPAGEALVLTEGLDGCLALFTERGWEDYRRLISHKASIRRNMRYFYRRLYQNTSQVRIDRSGRINIPDKLLKLAGLGKEVLVIGVDQKIEIWDPPKYAKYLEEFGQTYEDVAEEVAEELHRDESGR